MVERRTHQTPSLQREARPAPVPTEKPAKKRKAKTQDHTQRAPMPSFGIRSWDPDYPETYIPFSSDYE